MATFTWTIANLERNTADGGVKDALGVDRVTELQEKVYNDVQAQKAPTQQSGVPW